MSSPAPDSNGARRIGKPVLAVCAVLMAAPAAIPVYFALGAEDSTTALFLVLMGVAILLGNALLFTVIYRWFRGVMEE